MSNKKEITREENIEPLTLEQVCNDIPQVIEDFCLQHNIDDLTKESTNIFNALLIDINEKIITPNKHLLKIPNKTNNKYNPSALWVLLNIYEKLCLLYDNAITIYGYGLLTGLTRQAIYDLEHDKEIKTHTSNITGISYTPDKTGLDIWQKLRESEEQTTLNCRKYNDLRIIARLNRITGGAYRDYTQVDTGESRPKATAEQIADKYGNAENTGFSLPNNEE